MCNPDNRVLFLQASETSKKGNGPLELLVILLASLVAIISARTYAGSWNDGGRLASVEALVDYHTFSIDQSIFIDAKRVTGLVLPYPADDRNLIENGTRDKLLINGHYYSDKQMIVSLWMAGIYAVLEQTTGLVARNRPDLFAYFMTLATSGIAYVLATWGMARLALQVGLSRRNVLLLTASFSLSTAALPYACHVNQHIVFWHLRS